MDRFIFYAQDYFYRFTDFLTNTFGLSATVMAWIVLLLSVILFFIRKARKEDEPLSGRIYIVSNTLFLVTCFFEIMHAVTADDMIWFCMPDRVGWMATIVNFVLLGLIAYNQILYFMDVIGDVLANGEGCDIRMGLYSWAGGLALMLLCAMIFAPAVIIVLGLLVAVQIAQIVMFFRSYGSNLKGAFFCSFVYLLGGIGTFITVGTFVSILILVLIAVAFLWVCSKVFGWGSKSKRKTGRVMDKSGHTIEEVEETGRGVLGETYWTGKDSGKEYTET